MAREEVKEKLKFTILWRIENLSYWNKEISSPYIDVFACRSIIKLFARNKTEDNVNMIAKLIAYPTHYSESISIGCEWSLLDNNGSPLFTSIVQNHTLGFGLPLYLPGFPTYEEVFVTKKSSFLPNDTLTIMLSIWKSDGELAQAEQISAFTRITVVEESILWRLEGFRSLQLNQEMTTPLSLDFPMRKVVYKLKLFLTGSSLSEAKVKFEIVAENPNDQTMTVVLSILDKGKEVMKCLEEKHAFVYNIPKQIWVLSNFVERQEILDWLHGDDLHLLCKFTVVLKDNKAGIDSSYYGPENLKPDVQSSFKILKNEKKGIESVSKTKVSSILKGNIQTSFQCAPKGKNLSQAILGEDLASLYRDQIFSDFELESGDVPFPVHKMILSARSPVFRAMFCGDMKEAISIDVPDLDVHTLGQMLTFLYTGTLDDLQWESAVKLYYAAVTYQVPSLKQLCSSVLRSDITISNVSDILELADRHQDQELTSDAHNFIQNNFDEVIFSDEWDEFLGRSYLAGKTMRDVYKKKISSA